MENIANDVSDLESLEERIKFDMFLKISPFCEELYKKRLHMERVALGFDPESMQVSPSPTFQYHRLPFWFHNKVEPSMFNSRNSYSSSTKVSHYVPDIEFLASVPANQNTNTNTKSHIDSDTQDTPCPLKVSFRGWRFLNMDRSISRNDQFIRKLTEDTDYKDQIVSTSRASLTQSEQSREDARTIVVRVLDMLMQVGHSYGIRFVFTEVDLSHTDCSMRAIFNGVDGLGNPIGREKEVEILDLSYTRTSSRSLKNFCKASNLKVLLLDHCLNLKRDKHKVETHVFSLLVEYKIPMLEVLSVVGTSQLLSSDWINQVDKGCPMLKTLYFTRKPGEKALGWDDIILMQSMRDPHLLPCGHIADKFSLVSLVTKECSLDRTPFNVQHLVPVVPHITRLRRSEGGWTAEIVDYNRQPLDDKVLYHVSCGEFYNLRTLQAKYHIPIELIVDSRLVEALEGKACLGCYRSFGVEDLRLCFPHSARLDELQQFDSLSNISLYTTET